MAALHPHPHWTLVARSANVGFQAANPLQADHAWRTRRAVCKLIVNLTLGWPLRNTSGLGLSLGHAPKVRQGLTSEPTNDLVLHRIAEIELCGHVH
jgi:hypothetical protein